MALAYLFLYYTERLVTLDNRFTPFPQLPQSISRSKHWGTEVLLVCR